MSKYHISLTTGRPNKCYAEKRPCPIGGADEHYGSKEEAQQAYEARMSASTVAPAQKKNRSAEDLIAEWKEVRKERTDEAWARARELEEELKVAMPAPPTPQEMMANITTPAGFTRTEGTWPGYVWGNQPPKNLPQLTLEGDGITIQINFGDDKEGYMLADGHVSFTSEQGTRTFDRRGVDDSFYIDNPRKQFSLEDPTRDTNATIQDFIDRKVPEARARIAGSEQVPGLNGRLATKAQKQQLLDKGTLDLYPSGFGTGYHFMTSAAWANQPGVREGSEEQKRFFGVKNLWVSTFDCD